MKHTLCIRPASLTLLFFVLLITSCGKNDSGTSIKTPGTAIATQGTLEITVRGKGELKPLKEEAINSQTWGVIAFMWDHGQPVKAGDVVLRLDDSDTKENLERDRLELAIRQARLVKTDKTEAKRLHSAELGVKSTETVLTSKKIELEELRNLPDPDKLENARNTLASAQRILELRTSELDIVRKLYSKGAVSYSDVQNAETELDRARIDMEKAKTNLHKTEAGPSVEEMRQGELAVQMEQLNQDRTAKQYKATESSCETNVENARRNVKQQQDTIKRNEDRLKKFTEKAPTDGVALYAPGHHGMPWQPGSDTGRGLKIMSIPDLSKMKAVVSIPENDISGISKGQKARIRVTAIQNMVFTGEVTKIVELAKDEFEDLDAYTKEKLGRAERRVFTVEITLNEQDARLCPGFNAFVEIIVDEKRDAVIIPLAAVAISSTGESYVELLLPSGDYVKTPVEVAAYDGGRAQVSGGIKPGDAVKLITDGEKLFRAGNTTNEETANGG
jgi:HlyD family secretion protein